ncbi:MAG: M23 family metallopeptidase [Patescibacteria group bacterium]|jgi:murein DD-endopeptidase MepM/ murein hydrolase activator NlpD
MKSHYKTLLIIFLPLIIIVIFSVIYFKNNQSGTTVANKNINSSQNNKVNSLNVNNIVSNENISTSTSQKIKLTEPVPDFVKGVTLKPFGIYITPQNSPVQPEKFTGYHTGADAEFTDVTGEVPVKAIAPGQVVYSGTASGYGGVIVIRHLIDGKEILTVYGHLQPSSLLPRDAAVTTGQQIGVLGEGYTSQTDYERKHLHLAMLKGAALSLKGYVSTKEELAGWYNPLDFF